MVTAVLAAAGQGRRMGCGGNKIFLTLEGLPLFIHGARTLSACRDVDEIIVVTGEADIPAVKAALAMQPGLKPWQVVAGGSERQYSVEKALAAVPMTAEYILVHDAARPLVAVKDIEAVIAAAREHKAAVLAVPVKDTIKQAGKDGNVAMTFSRELLWAVQTPQVFAADVLRQAYKKAAADGFLGTDDASLLEHLGITVQLVEGSYRNIKITTPEDMLVAGAFSKGGQTVDRRSGLGYDVHRLVEGRPLMLGGVAVPYERGLLGHSDADVLLHAVADALLGAAALGDIGRHFPDDDDAFAGISSVVLLVRVRDMLSAEGFAVDNIDATIVAQKPKLAPYIPAMNETIARTLGIEQARVNVKATTTEGLGFAGTGEGIAAYATAAIRKQPGSLQLLLR